MRFKAKFFMMAMLVGSMMPFNSYADVNDRVVANNAYYESLPEYHWENEGGEWYYKSEDGTIKTGKFWDENGEIYDTDENGAILRNECNANGEYFDENGRLVNVGCAAYKTDRYERLCKRFEKGDKLTFSSLADRDEFLAYYMWQYRLKDQNCTFLLNESNDKYTATLQSDGFYDREKYMQLIRQLGPLEGNTAYEKIQALMDKLNSFDFGLYTLDYDLQECMEKKIGCCFHFTRIAHMLLKDAGIPNEVVVGKCNGNNHGWIAAMINGKKVYIDPASVISGDDTCMLLNYDTYCRNYQVMDMIATESITHD